MIIWLDFKAFGSGWGLAMPHCDGILYWLKNANTGRSEFYTFSPGFGAQLTSFQWRHPNVGEERELAGRKFRPLHSHRGAFGRVAVSWSLQGIQGKPLGEQRAALDALLKALREPYSR